MKTHNQILKTLILIIAISVSGLSNARADYKKADGKKVVRISVKEPLIKLLSNSMVLSQAEIENIKDQISEANIFLVSNNISDFEIDFEASANEGSLFVVEYLEESPGLESWMFDEDYYSYETEPAIEDWMLEEDYLYTEAGPVFENWMFEEDYLYNEAEPVIEDWMLEEDYLYTEAGPVMEDWMLDEDYYSSNENAPEFEKWMFNEDYLNTESVPVLEDWMLDGTYFN